LRKYRGCGKNINPHIRCDDKEFSFPPLGKVPQEPMVAGEAENLVKKRLETG
jgi:hypothetical protein